MSRHSGGVAFFGLAVVLVLCGLWLDVPNRSSALAQNLLVNPGFEAGSAGWHVKPSTASFDVVGEPTHQGQGAAAVTKTASRGWAFTYQDVLVTPGEWYNAQVWALWDTDLLTNVKLRVEWFDANEERLRLDELALEERGPAFQLLELIDLEAPAEAVVGRVEGYTFVDVAAPDPPALFDDFQFVATGSATNLSTPTPEPLATATTTATVTLPVPTAPPTTTPASVPAGAVVINEVFYDPSTPGGDPDDEWVELYNVSSRVVDLGGWVLADHVGEDSLPAVKLSPQAFVVVASTDSFRSLYPAYEGLLITLNAPIGNGLRNDGDSLWLKDNQSRTIDAMAYGDDAQGAMFPPVPIAPEGYSLERLPAGRDTNTATDWYPRSTPSPGQGIRIRQVFLPLISTTEH